MCQFKSAIVTPNADVLHNAYTDSHEDLVRLFKLNDTASVRGEPRFCRVEFYPDDKNDLADVDKFKLHIDEPRKPDWFTKEMEARTTAKLRLLVSAMIITGDVDMLCGGAYILAKGAKVQCVKNAFIQVMLGSSKVGVMRGSSKVLTDNRVQ